MALLGALVDGEGGGLRARPCGQRAGHSLSDLLPQEALNFCGVFRLSGRTASLRAVLCAGIMSVETAVPTGTVALLEVDARRRVALGRCSGLSRVMAEGAACAFPASSLKEEAAVNVSPEVHGGRLGLSWALVELHETQKCCCKLCEGCPSWCESSEQSRGSEGNPPRPLAMHNRRLKSSKWNAAGFKDGRRAFRKLLLAGGRLITSLPDHPRLMRSSAQAWKREYVPGSPGQSPKAADKAWLE
mmetsp:Transcript_23677/g.65668  ORF Transcript_23677/g.65668 Transcript_23677/m.65668 type:complete len:244 (-) Transcript_23677:1003-1734(-)